MESNTIIASTPDDFPRQAVSIITERAKSAVTETGRFTLTLCGGSTVTGPFRQLAASKDIPWENTCVFWGDDRFVGPDHPDSNYKLARDLLLGHLSGLPAENIFPVPHPSPSPGVPV